MVVKNATFLFLLQGVNYLAPLLLIPVYINVLGLDQYGQIALWMAIIQFCYILTDFGFLSFATKEITDMSGDVKRISTFFSTVYCLKAFVFLFVSMLLIIYVLFNPAPSIVVMSAIATIFCQCYQPVWFFHGIEKMKFVALYFSISKLLFLLIVIVFIDENSSWDNVIVFWFLSQLIGCIILNYQYRVLGYSFSAPLLKDIKELFFSSLHFFVSRLSVASYTSLNVIILSSLSPNANLGLFAICDQVFKAGQAATSPITQALYPYMLRTKNWAFYIKLTLISLVILSIGLLSVYFLYESFFDIVFDEEVDQINTILPIFLLLIFVNFIARNIGNPLFGPLQKLNIANNSVIFGALLHLVLVFWLYVNEQLSAISLSYCILFIECSILLIRAGFLITNKSLFKV
jgi:O-antigen/teichoic acid export membrane protein